MAVRRLRSQYSQEHMLTEDGRDCIKCLEATLSFSNHAVEQEHKKFADISGSATSGAEQG